MLVQSLSCTLAVTMAGLVALASAVSPASAQEDPRSMFPGRRIGGGTRGECNARIVAHLVPASSVFSPGETGSLGLVQGPTAQPLPLQVSFRSQSEKSAERPTVRTISAAPAAVVLFQNQVAGPTIWESAFDCTSTDGAALEDPLSFVQTTSPPALSLLMSVAEDSDVRVQEGLAELRRQCGSDVPTQLTMARFGLADLVTPEWPSQLPVRCPS